MIDRQLRPIGEAIRFVWPSFSERKFKFCNFILKNFGRGADVTPWKIKCEQIKIPRTDGSELRLCVYSPRKREGEMPGLLWIHGGGYAMGIPEQDHGFVRAFVGTTGCVMVVPDYKNRSMPPFPLRSRTAISPCSGSRRTAKNTGCGGTKYSSAATARAAG